MLNFFAMMNCRAIISFCALLLSSCLTIGCSKQSEAQQLCESMLATTHTLELLKGPITDIKFEHFSDSSPLDNYRIMKSIHGSEALDYQVKVNGQPSHLSFWITYDLLGRMKIENVMVVDPEATISSSVISSCTAQAAKHPPTSFPKAHGFAAKAVGYRTIRMYNASLRPAAGFTDVIYAITFTTNTTPPYEGVRIPIFYDAKGNIRTIREPWDLSSSVSNYQHAVGFVRIK